MFFEILKNIFLRDEKHEKLMNFEDLVNNGGRHPSDDVETIQTLRSRVLATKISLCSVHFSIFRF